MWWRFVIMKIETNLRIAFRYWKTGAGPGVTLVRGHFPLDLQLYLSENLLNYICHKICYIIFVKLLVELECSMVVDIFVKRLIIDNCQNICGKVILVIRLVK